MNELSWSLYYAMFVCGALWVFGMYGLLFTKEFGASSHTLILSAMLWMTLPVLLLDYIL